MGTLVPILCFGYLCSAIKNILIIEIIVMKKIFFLLLGLLFIVSVANAQKIDKGSYYIGAKSTGLDFSFSDKVSLGMHANGGYFIMDKLAVGGEFGFLSYDSNTSFRLMANASYYFLETSSGALYGRFGTGLDKYVGGDTSVAIDISGGYSFFVTENIAIEPTAGFFIPFKEGRDASFNIGVGFCLYF